MVGVIGWRHLLIMERQEEMAGNLIENVLLYVHSAGLPFQAILRFNMNVR